MQTWWREDAKFIMCFTRSACENGCKLPAAIRILNLIGGMYGSTSVMIRSEAQGMVQIITNYGQRDLIDPVVLLV